MYSGSRYSKNEARLVIEGSPRVVKREFFGNISKRSVVIVAEYAEESIFSTIASQF